MPYDFSTIKNENEVLKKEMGKLKKEYRSQEMPYREYQRLQRRIEEAKRLNRRARLQKSLVKAGSVAAVLLVTLITLPNVSYTIAHAMTEIPLIGRVVRVVTFRDYQYETERHSADIVVPQITLVDLPEDSLANDSLNQTLDGINTDIQKISAEIIAEFERYLNDEQGYQDVIVKSDILTSTSDYFTIRLFCYQGAGSGYQWNYYYTIDLKTGERLKLKDLFLEGADYITPISDNIKQQMEAQMLADDNVHYWLNDEIEELNFKTITDETSFYVNAGNHIVIAFNEGDVAPMYMGSLEFEIPSEVLASIRR